MSLSDSRWRMWELRSLREGTVVVRMISWIHCWTVGVLYSMQKMDHVWQSLSTVRYYSKVTTCVA